MQLRHQGLSSAGSVRARSRKQGASHVQLRSAPLHRLASGPAGTQDPLRGMAGADAECALRSRGAAGISTGPRARVREIAPGLEHGRKAKAMSKEMRVSDSTYD